MFLKKLLYCVFFFGLASILWACPDTENDDDSSLAPTASPGPETPTVKPDSPTPFSSPAPTLEPPTPTPETSSTPPFDTPTPTPPVTPSPTPSPTPAPSPTPMPTPAPSPTPSPTPMPTPVPSPTPMPSPTPVPTPTPNPTPVPTSTPNPTPTPTPSPTPTPFPPTPTPPVDEDGDGYPAAIDCNDSNPDIHPNAQEVCNGIDDDCDDVADDGLAILEWYVDDDGDGYGTPDTFVEDCAAPQGYVTDSSDCDDTDATIHPGAAEVCNGLDDDCDEGQPGGGIDEGVKKHFFEDKDGDSYGAGDGIEACELPAGYVEADPEAGPFDCDDGDAAVFPGADETCNKRDDNCNGEVDEGLDASTWYADADEDGYGDPDDRQEDCALPDGYIADSSDCDDTLASVNPGADEVCNEIDDNCDDTIDEDLTSFFYFDEDEDGFGTGDPLEACNAPAGYASFGADCDDTNPDINPDAPELCNGQDDNCNEEADEGLTLRHLVDTTFSQSTPGSDVDLIVVREKYYDDLDLTSIGYGTYTRVQSIFLRVREGTNSNREYFLTRVRFSEGVRVAELVWIPDSGGKALENTDVVFGVQSPTYYLSSDNRDVDDTLGDYIEVVSESPWTVEQYGYVDSGADDTRTLIEFDEGVCSASMTLTLTQVNSSYIKGFRVGDPTGKDGVPGSGDYGEVLEIEVPLLNSEYVPVE